MALATSNWFAIGASDLIEPSTVHQAFLFGQELAVWRSESGTIHAWDNRCPHRSVRLSLGFVDGERLVCRYHGWRYRADGKCAHIPAHPGLTPTPAAAAATRPCNERDGLVWVCLDTQHTPDPPSLASRGRYRRSYLVGMDAERVLLLARRDGWTSAFPQVLRASAPDGCGAYLAVQPLRAGCTSLHLVPDQEDAADVSWPKLNAWVKEAIARWRKDPQGRASTEALNA